MLSNRERGDGDGRALPCLLRRLPAHLARSLLRAMIRRQMATHRQWVREARSHSDASIFRAARLFAKTPAIFTLDSGTRR